MLNIVLYQPEIYQNTGNIIRTCVALDAKLHLIRPYGFILSETNLKRMSAGYYEHIQMEEYDEWDDFLNKQKPDNLFFLTRYGKKTHSNYDFKSVKGDIYLVFGKESTGVPYDLLKSHLDTCLRVPMSKNVRSINLANTVAIMGYDVMRQLDYPNLSKVEIQKGEDFLNNV